MSRTEPDSSAILEGGVRDELPSTASEVAGSFLPSGGRTSDTAGDDAQWLQTANSCYRQSTDFFDANLRVRMEESADLYRSKHPRGSKYNLASFSKRSKLFRPKTRAAMRKLESKIAKAFFATNDIVSIQAPNTGDKLAVQAAKIQELMLNYRLKKTMHWFETVIGAFQDASKQGFVVSRTDWEYKQAKRYYTEVDELTGDHKRTTEDVVISDTPVVVLVPAENIRISPACDWRDPIGSSPYVIELMPMTIEAVREMMDRDSMFTWRDVTDDALNSGAKQSMDSIRSAREGSRQDRYDATSSGPGEYDTVWIHRNIVRIEGEDYIYLTVGTTVMLTDPMPLIEVDPRGYRGYEWGFTVLESHNPYPDGDVQLTKAIQEEINEVANMRADALKMATVGRYFVKRNSSIDTQALVRFVPGSSIEVNNVQSDVRWDKSPDVGRGTFEEQNLLNMEMDDLTGNFNTGSVGANRQLNETVGGMELISDNANEISEFTARVFTETWIEKVLAHVLDLMCIWETDTTIATLIGERANVEMVDVFRSMKSPMGVVVGVGFGATNPEQRIRRMQIAFGILGQVSPTLLQSADQGEIAAEVMGALGYPDAQRFFPTLAEEGEKDPAVKALEEQVAQLTQMVQTKQMEIDGRVQVAQISADARLQIEQLKVQSRQAEQQAKAEMTMAIEQAKGELAMIDLRMRYETSEQKKAELYMQREALSHTIQMAEREFAFKVEQANLAQQNLADAAGRDAAAAAPAQTPPGIQRLIKNLSNPGSNTVDLEDGDVGLPPVGGDDKAGVMARGNYGNIPGMEG